MAGRVWHRLDMAEYFLNAIDADNAKALEELCSRNDGATISQQQLTDWADSTLVEQHADNKSKAHIYLYSKHPFNKKSSDPRKLPHARQILPDKVPVIDVKSLGSHGIMCCSPSIHMNGYQYEIVGTAKPALCDEFDLHLDNICRKYSIPWLFLELIRQITE